MQNTKITHSSKTFSQVTWTDKWEHLTDDGLKTSPYLVPFSQRDFFPFEVNSTNSNIKEMRGWVYGLRPEDRIIAIRARYRYDLEGGISAINMSERHRRTDGLHLGTR